MFAGHLPTKHFDLAEWSAMPVASDDTEVWPGDGFHRAYCRGRPIVFYVPPVDSGEVGFSARPIVRVKMGRRVIDEDQSAFEGWMHGSQWTPFEVALLRNIRRGKSPIEGNT